MWNQIVQLPKSHKSIFEMILSEYIPLLLEIHYECDTLKM